MSEDAVPRDESLEPSSDRDIAAIDGRVVATDNRGRSTDNVGVASANVRARRLDPIKIADDHRPASGGRAASSGIQNGFAADHRLASGIDGPGIGNQPVGAHNDVGFGDDYRWRCSLAVSPSDVVINGPDNLVQGFDTYVRRFDVDVGSARIHRLASDLGVERARIYKMASDIDAWSACVFALASDIDVGRAPLYGLTSDM